MSLPYSYKNTIEFADTDNFSNEECLWEIYHHFKKSDSVKDLSVDDRKIILTFRSLFTINYPVEIEFFKNSEIKIEYEIKLVKLIQVCVALTIFIAFFSKFEIAGYLWFSAIFIIIFFGLNLIFVDNLVQKLINSSPFLSNLKSDNEDIISKEQKDWIKNPEKCPACGEDITEYDLKCPECGIRLREKAPLSPFNVSKYNQKRFKYFYKKNDLKNDT